MKWSNLWEAVKALWFFRPEPKTKQTQTHTKLAKTFIFRHKLKTADTMWRHALQSPPNKLRLQLKIKASHRDPERTNSFIRGKKETLFKEKLRSAGLLRHENTHIHTHGISKLAVESNWVTVEFGLTEGRLVEHEIRALYSSLAGERRLTETERKGVRVCVCVCYLWQVREGKAERLGERKGLSTVAVLSGGKERDDYKWTWEKGQLTVTSVNNLNRTHWSHNMVLKTSFGECDLQPRSPSHLSFKQKRWLSFSSALSGVVLPPAGERQRDWYNINLKTSISYIWSIRYGENCENGCKNSFETAALKAVCL